MQELSRRVFAERFPSAPYEEEPGFDMEIYGGAMEGANWVYCEEVWIRVRYK